MKIFLLSMIVVASFTSGMAQEARVVVNPRVEDEVVRSYYNDRENRTMTSVFIPLSIQIFGEQRRLEINAHFSHQGRQLIATPDDVQVVFSVPCNFGNQLDSDPAICVDGECSSYHPRGEGVCAGGLLRERTSRMIDLPYEMFLKIVRGQKVKIQLASSEVELTSEQLGVLRSLAHRMLPREVHQSH